ncbi:MAG: PAS domain-containing protein [Dehalococcoidia bacterium]|nr:PAS domain-containing protein [Dehalococcoidia bacterium]
MNAALAVLAAGLLLAPAYLVYLFLAAGRLRSASRALATGGSSGRLPVAGPPVLAEAASAVNDAVQAFERSVADATDERDRLLAAIEASGDGIIALARDRTVVLVNPAAHELLGPGQVLMGVPLAQALRDHEITTSVERALERSATEALTTDYGTQRRQIQVTVTPLPESATWGALLVIHDLADLRRVDRTRREFVSNVSHELRTPLASIKAAVETLEEGALEDTDAARSFLDSIHVEVDRMTQLVEELLELSRIESGSVPFERRPIDVSAVIKAASERIAPQATRQGLNLTSDIEEGIRFAVGDQARLEQVLVNLLQNAVKFTEPGGTVVVHASVTGDHVLVAVEDNGRGVARADLPHIFERFYKADRARASGGTGLGLAIVKHTIQAHGGEVWAESEPGIGSTFSFTIPRHD